MTADKYDVVVVGTGFASSFFLRNYLRASGEGVRVLVLERGGMVTHPEQLEHGPRWFRKTSPESFINATPRKPWTFTLSFGGGSNCWVAGTPRMLPEDFRLRSLYGVGADWPVTYEELEPYYCEAEDVMAIAGPSDDSPFPRSRPYPQPPHRFSDVDRLFKRAYPDQFFAQPSARPSQSTENRPRCCANSVCSLCPINSKFTILSEMGDLYSDPRVTLVLGATVQQVDVSGGEVAEGVVYTKDGALERARGDLVVLGANAIFNPHILLSSGLEHPELGRGITEQVSQTVVVHLDGVDNFQGSSYIIGHGYMLYPGPHRADRAAALIETSNRPELRNERGKWRQLVRLRVVYEDLRRPENHVGLSEEDPSKPKVFYAGHSPYAQRGLDALPGDLKRILAPLPVEDVLIEPEPNPTEAHIIGSTPMGNDPSTSIVDRHLMHHQVRNLLVLGSSTYPTAAPANPTLTLSALALRSADYVTGARAAA